MRGRWIIWLVSIVSVLALAVVATWYYVVLSNGALPAEDVAEVERLVIGGFGPLLALSIGATTAELLSRQESRRIPPGAAVLVLVIYVVLFSFLALTLYWMVDHRSVTGESWLLSIRQMFSLFAIAQGLLLAMLGGTLHVL